MGNIDVGDRLLTLLSTILTSGNQPFYIPEVPPFKLQRDIIDFSDYDNDTDVDDCPLRQGFHWQNNLTNQKAELNQSKWLYESRLDTLFSIRLLLLQLQKYFSRWPRHRHSGQAHPDWPKYSSRLGQVRRSQIKESHCCGYEK